jgi:5'-nucleotidase
MRHSPARVLVVVIALVGLVACGGDDDATTTTASATETTPAPTSTTTAEPETLRILASNDDGISHPGLDLMVRRMQELPDVEVSVVAPAENMSGSSDSTTEGGAPHRPATTASGIEGTAVEGFPADAVVVALDELELEPHLVVSGINDAQNIGPFAELSGTVGVARTAVRRGIPGVAVSAGLQYDDAEFGVAANLVIDWINEHRDALVDGSQPTDEAISFNIPSCAPEEMGELVEVLRAAEFPEGVNPFESECSLADPEPADDYAALRSGYPAVTRIPPDF